MGYAAHPQEEVRDETPLYEQEQVRKVKTRFRMLQNAQKISHNVSLTCRFFGISRAQYYIWLRRYEKSMVHSMVKSGDGIIRS